MRKILPYDALTMPKEAKCVFKGEIFSVYQWQQVLFDGSTTVFEMLKRPDTVIAVTIKNNKVVLINERNPGYPSMFHFPGGRVKPGDDSWTAAVQREIREETGMSFRNWRLIHVSQPATKIEWFVAWYLATDLSEEQSQSLDGGEEVEVILEPIDNAVRRVYNTNKIEAKYIPEVVLNSRTIEELLNAPEFIGDTVELE